MHIFDALGIGRGVSALAAGLLHPYVGAHAKLNWRGQEGMQATQKLLAIASDALGRSVYAHHQGILRLALSQEQFRDFQLCAEHHRYQTEWLEASACQLLAPGCALAPGLWIKQGLIVYPKLYLEGLWRDCKRQGAQFEQRMISSLADLQDFDVVVVTAGAESVKLPELAHLPLNRVKGQVLELSWPQDLPPLRCALNSHVYLLMTENHSSCLVGATYERGHQEAEVDLEMAQSYLLPKAYELYPPLKHASLVNCYAGMRAVSPQHRPFIQRLSASKWVLSGMGSKGLLYHALFAQELVKMVWHESSTSPS